MRTAENAQGLAVLVKATGTGAAAQYVYDGEGRRVQKVMGGVTTNYIYDAQGELAAEYAPNPAATGTQYLTVDHLGSTRLVTNGTGTVVSRYDYLPFGEEIFAPVGGRTTAMGYLSAPDPLNPKFTGKLRDNETGLDFMEARYYSGAEGRFTIPDWSAKEEPVPYAKLEDPQSLNLYAYVQSNPLSRFDADGHCSSGGFLDLSGPCIQEWAKAAVEFVGGVGQGITASESLGAVGAPSPSDSMASRIGQAVGAGIAGVVGTSASVGGAGVAVATSPTGAGVVAGGAVAVAGAATAIGAAKEIGAIVTTPMAAVKANDAPGTSASGQATDAHGNKLGGSGKPQQHSTTSNTREAARNRALNEGSTAVNHSNPKQGQPHFHAGDAEGNKTPNSVHHEYPE